MAQDITVKTVSQSKPISETRRIRKPLMERKRRERINSSLNELARLLTEAQKVSSEGGKPAKLEKADILELTVKHLQSLSDKPDSIASKQSVTDEEKYREGFSECIKVVEKVLKKSTGENLKERLLTHLHARLKALKGTNKRSFVEEKQDEKENRVSPMEDISTPNYQNRKHDINNVCSLTLVPKELPDGGMAFVLTGNPQKLLKEWGNISTVETRVPCNSENISTSPNYEHPSSHSTCPSSIDYSNDQNYVISPSENQNLSSSPSTSYAEIKMEQDKSYHTLQPLKSQMYYASCSTPCTSKSQNKASCPPTPPPSPLTTYGPKAPYKIPLQPVSPERRMEDQNANEPFDLSIARMWRPW